MDRTVLMTTIGGRDVAVPAETISSVVELEDAVRVPAAPSHVVGLAALRSQVMTVIDTRAALGIEAREYDEQAPVVSLDGHLFALRVDAVGDIAVVDDGQSAMPCDFGEQWQAVALGLVEQDGRPAILLDVRALLGMDLQAAA